MKRKRLISFMLVFALLGTIGSGCSKSEGTYKAGTYEATVKGHNDDLSVEVVVDSEKITGVKVTKHAETESIAGKAISDIPQAIVENQSLAIDAIAGATVTSNAILAGAKEALSKAGADIEKLMLATKDEKTGKEIVVDADVVVIGAGAAGFAAALKASEAGKTVVILEKMPVVGGNTIRAGGAMNAADPTEQKNQEMSNSELEAIQEMLALEPKNEDMKRWQASVQKDIDEYVASGSTYLYDSVDLHKLQTYVDGDYVGNTVQIEYLCDHSLESIHWLEDQGVEFKEEIQAVVGALWKRSHALVREDEKGTAIIEPLEAAAKKNGVIVYLETKAESLITKDSVVVGVTATNTQSKDTYVFNAKEGVIIATGGFAANVEMREKYNTSGKWANLGADIPTSNHPGATGDGIIMAQEVGAAVVDMEQIQLIPTWPKSGGSTIKGYINNVIYVNQEGDRYVREDGRRDELSIGALKQPGSYFFVINDYEDTMLNGYTDEALKGMIDAGMIWSGDTIEELAENMGADPVKLRNSIDKFNQAVDGTIEDEFGRKVFDKKIQTAPFYASSFVPASHHTMGGLKVNTSAQVLDEKDQVIKGLYAAGEVTGGLHGANRLGGNAVPDAIVNGMNAGEQISK